LRPVKSEAASAEPAAAGEASEERADRFTISVVEGLDALRPYRDGWVALVDRAAEPNLFLEPWVVEAALASRIGRPPRFVLVHEPLRPHLANRRLLVGVFALESTRLAGVRTRVTQLWRHPFAYLTTPLLDREFAQSAMAAFCDWLEEQNSGLLRLQMISGDGPVRRLWVDEINRRGWPYLLDDVYSRAVLRPAAGGEAYLAESIDGKRRKNLRRLRDRLSETGELTWDGYVDGAALEPWITEFLALEAGGWKGARGSAILSNEAHAGFIRGLFAQAAERKRLEMLALRVDGRAIAMKVNLWGPTGGGGEVGYAFRIAFDEAYARYSPGMLLEVENVLRFHSRLDARWMDSCASRDRFIVDHFWRDRRMIETWIAAPAGRGELALCTLPLLRWFDRTIFRRRQRDQEQG